ncbi:hypothetical protein BpHYR1_044504 [Brachionus plicatilis]|uniref:Uncharacterized protein n=1 Tax=Brachionus plicatilis TaxID=10195 RepID=A0A3M7SYT5_BRAPC|nr:hypothetical protein BpHYR1_044504 [Brachionus plicatilis]
MVTQYRLVENGEISITQRQIGILRRFDSFYLKSKEGCYVSEQKNPIQVLTRMTQIGIINYIA